MEGTVEEYDIMKMHEQIASLAKTKISLSSKNLFRT